MAKKVLFPIIILALLLFGAVLWYGQLGKEISESRKPSIQEPKKFHFAQYADKEFYGNIDTAEPMFQLEKPATGLIVSHHMYVSEHIAKLYSVLKAKNIQTVAIIGPNHFNRGDRIMVSEYDYQTPWGILETDRTITGELKARNIASVDEKPFEIEHSISSQVGFIKAVAPNAKIVPIMLKRSVTEEEAAQVAQALHELLPENSVVVASVDFAHHTDNLTAQVHDKQAISILENFEFEKMYSIDADSPPSLYAVLKFMELRGAKNMQYQNTNAAIVSGNLAHKDVTSYVFAAFTK
jgi:MEMO1 family protein